MTASAPTLGKFVVRTFLWLPPCFAAWYFSAPYHAAPAGRMAQLWLEQFAFGIVSALEQPATDLVFVTTIKMHSATGQSAVLLPEVNPLLYTYGLAFFLALMLAAGAKWWKILLGATLLLPFQSWGIAFDFLAQVGTKFGPDVSAQAGLFGWRLEAVVLGYQVGNLVFPSLVPVLLWAFFNRRFIEQVLRPQSCDPRTQPQ